MADQQSSNNTNLGIARVGLNTDLTSDMLPQGALTYALNAQVESFDGNSITYQNEQGNLKCFELPEGYQTINVTSITSIERVVYFLTNSSTGDSEIGYVDNNNCNYITLISDKNNSDKFNFSIDHPIHKVVIKTTNCSIQLYWTDYFNPRRYLDFDSLPWKEIPNPQNKFKPTLLVGQLDSNKLLIQPVFKLPITDIESVVDSGSLVSGVYQFAVRYSNALAEGYTSFYNITNPVTIGDNKITPNFNLETSKSINLKIENLDTTDIYEYIDVVAIKTINDITTVELVGNYRITDSTLKINYSGANKTAKKFDIIEVFERFPFYNLAKGIYDVDNIIGWYGLEKKEALNYQSIFSKVRTHWQTWKLPYNKFEAYNNGVNSAKYRGYMRDEVYPLEGCLVFDNGEESVYCHIPSREATTDDLVIIDNDDANSIQEDKCAEPIIKRKWEVYNTAINRGKCQEYLDYKGDKDCYIGPYEWGDFAYWESNIDYPGNTDIWDTLTGKPQRHHKFPDSLVTHIHDNNDLDNPNYQHSIYPIGIKIDIQSLYQAINTSNLRDAQKRSIVGFKIARGDRANNKSIIAKGLFNNVGKYTYVPTSDISSDIEGESQTYYVPNYPYNDLRPDPYFTDRPIKDHIGYRPDRALKCYDTDESKQRFTFHSPDTHFKQPFGIDTGQIKIETIEYGKSHGHFVPVDENAEYLFINSNGYKVAYGGGIASTINGTVTYTTPWDYGIGANFTPENFGPAFESTLEILRKTLPYTNFGYNFNSKGSYDKFYAVPNEGLKIRNIDFGIYLKPEYTDVEAGNKINNYQRESSIYLYANKTILYPHEYSTSIPEDTSRYNISSYINNDLWGIFFPLFLSNNSLITTSDIINGIATSIYTGPIVNKLTLTGVYIGQKPQIGDTYDYLDKNQNSKGVVTLITVKQLGSTFPYSDYEIEFIVDSNIETDILNTLTEDASDHSGNTAIKFVYNNNNGSTINNQNTLLKLTGFGIGSPSIFPNTFASLEGITYQSYISADFSKLVATSTLIQGIYANVLVEEDLEELNIVDPSTIDDFNHVAAYYAYINVFVKYQQDHSKQGSPDKIRTSDICSYYGSIKKNIPSQWGQMYSYKTIDTGYYHNLYNDNKEEFDSIPTVFGGDIFINRFALKTKLPIFEDNTVKDNDDSDIEYDKIATLTYPMFWFSTSPVSKLSDIAAYVAKKAKQVTNNADTLDAFQVMLAGVYAIEITFKILSEILSNLGVRNLNLDNFKSKDLYEQGLMYLFVYGVPYFFVESEINVDHRQASNEKEGDFYPNVAGDIPDEWLQEANVSIINDNVYYYNNTYSKQNLEALFPHLREDYDPNKLCSTKFPNRTVYSDKSSLEETKNNSLVYRPSAYFDLPKSYGDLTSIDRLQNKQLLVRFVNQSQIYNALTTVEVKNGPAAYLGNDKLFAGSIPLDLSDTDTGSGGSQHQFFIKTPYGALTIDAKRAEVILLEGNKPTNIADEKISKWLYENLPFSIIEDFPEVPIDNAYKNIGLHGTYDGFYNRILITKLDYKLLDNSVKYNLQGNYFYILNNNKETKINLEDKNYFCNKSWTLSFSFNTKSWVSYHSYTPNYYIEYDGYFQTNTNINGVQSIWDHNTDFTNFNTFYDIQYPYILEYPFYFKYKDEVLQNVKDYTSVRKYDTFDSYYEPDETIYFNKAEIYNNQQHSGLLELIASPKRNLAAKYLYPKYKQNSKEILVSKTDNFYNYNTFWDIIANKSKAMYSESCDLKLTNKTLNEDILDYMQKPYKKATFRGKELKIRHTLDNRHDIKLISRFIINETVNSYK